MTPIEQCAVAMYLKFGWNEFTFDDFADVRRSLGHSTLEYRDSIFTDAYCKTYVHASLWYIDPNKIKPVLERVVNE